MHHQNIQDESLEEGINLADLVSRYTGAHFRKFKDIGKLRQPVIARSWGGSPEQPLFELVAPRRASQLDDKGVNVPHPNIRYVESTLIIEGGNDGSLENRDSFLEQSYVQSYLEWQDLTISERLSKPNPYGSPYWKATSSLSGSCQDNAKQRMIGMRCSFLGSLMSSEFGIPPKHEQGIPEKETINVLANPSEGSKEGWLDKRA